MTKPNMRGPTVAIDGHVAARIQERRILLGLSQKQLANMVGVSSRQAHKYERGINRVSAGRLYEIAAAPNNPIAYLTKAWSRAVPSLSARISGCCSTSSRIFRDPEREAPGGDKSARPRSGNPLTACLGPARGRNRL